MDAKLARDVRLPKVYAAIITIGFLVLLLTAFPSERKQKFSQIDVKCINIVEPDGNLDMVIRERAIATTEARCRYDNSHQLSQTEAENGG